MTNNQTNPFPCATLAARMRDENEQAAIAGIRMTAACVGIVVAVYCAVWWLA